ncbi:MAG TPA: hypothetical protein VF660_12070, partial [Actinomycetota bacterium]
RRYPFAASLRSFRWVRRFIRRPTEKDWFIWQASGWAHVDGIRGDVDLDVQAPPTTLAGNLGGRASPP